LFYKVLDGVKVIEFGHLISGPFCAKILADLGAEVIKIEDPCGDEARKQEPFLGGVAGLERSGLFLYLNMNKKVITLNPETETGRRIFTQLLSNADIFVENNSQKKMKHLKFTYTQVKKINPRIIMTSITPFGQTGPYKDYKGGELVMTEMGGVGFLSTRELDTSRAPIKYPAHLFSHQAGLSAAVATLGALLYHHGTNSGEQLDISEQECVIPDVMNPVYSYSYTKRIASRAGPLSVAPHHLLPCKDGYIHNGFVREEHWRKFVDEVMGHPAWADKEIFKDYQTRAKHWDELKPLILEWTMPRTVDEIYRTSQEHRIPIGAVYSPEQVLQDRQMAARGFFVEIDSHVTGNLKYPGVPYIFSDIPKEAPTAAPTLGQNNEEIYCTRLGYTKSDLVKMEEAGII
jgi:crotonobetainyl-CoA:carnitine CoA-transferase CaiB-like acyl-CoA transferase